MNRTFIDRLTGEGRCANDPSSVMESDMPIQYFTLSRRDKKGQLTQQPAEYDVADFGGLVPQVGDVIVDENEKAVQVKLRVFSLGGGDRDPVVLEVVDVKIEKATAPEFGYDDEDDNAKYDDEELIDLEEGYEPEDPEDSTPDPVTPDPVTPDPVTPDPVTPDPV